MKDKKLIKILAIAALVVCGLVLAVAKPALAIVVPRALRFALFSQYYQASVMEAIKIIKLTYSDSARRNAESTFEKGEKVYVSIKIYEPGSGSKIKITDRIFNFKSGSLKNFKFSSVSIPTPTVDGNQFSASIETKNGNNYFDYEYEIAD
ncbi:MAG: hypothetical protein Q8M92_00410 [Candidatus Subteraquimicrobiales bacterium]|nr:hypothetical protein [Candidatus Subteraquimicrobiales bacterium]